MKAQTRKFQIVIVLVIMWFSFSLFNIMEVKAAETKPTLGVKIYKIQKEDEIEGLFEGAPDWQYFIEVWNGESWDIIDNRLDTSTDPIIVNEIHFFEVTTTEIQIRIRLWDIETVGSPDLADISGCVGGGLDNWGGGTIPRGAQYYGTYNIKTNFLSGDTTYLEEGYYKTSGDYDGSTATDENDASLWFSILDNYDSPVAKAGSDQSVWVGEKVNLDASRSTASIGSSLVQFQWDFENDGIYDTQGVQTSYTYNEKGVYTVKLKVTDSIGETDTDTCKITVHARGPSASFTYSPLEPTIRDTVYFYDTSTDPDSSIISWFWNFGDGTTSTIKDPSHNYADKGSYTVSLTVTDDDDKSDSVTKILTFINLPPTADFAYSPSSPIVGKDIQFSDKSSDPEGKSLEYLWDFGDGFTSSQRNPKHKFASSGLKGVKLTVTDDEGSTNWIQKSISLKANLLPVPEFSYSPENPKMNHDVQFTDESTDSDGYLVGWLWNFGDGSTSTKENPVHKYEEGGEYTVKLTVTDDADDKEDQIKIVKILQTHDLTVEVKDILGVKIANAEIELYADGESCASGKTDTNGKLTFTEIAEGQYDIEVKVLGQTVSLTRSLSQPVTAQVQVTLSTNTLGITGGIVVIAALGGFYLMRRKKTTLAAEDTNQEVESVSVVEDDSLKEKKKELERERIAEILQTFKNSFEKGEMDEETYLRLKAKYEKELEELE